VLHLTTDVKERLRNFATQIRFFNEEIYIIINSAVPDMLSGTCTRPAL
jgi:hypothetical protein